MRLVNCLIRFRRSLRRQPRSRRPELFQGRRGIELLEDRLVPSTLDVNASAAHYLASLGVANNLTLSQRLVAVLGPTSPEASTPIVFRIETVITDTAEKITVTGTDAPAFVGSGTNQVSTLLPLKSLLADVLDGNDVVNIQAINYTTTVRH